MISSLNVLNTNSAPSQRHSREYCAMYDICGERSDGKVLNCPYGSPSIKPDDTFGDTSLGCSCGDCPSSSTCSSPKPLPPHEEDSCSISIGPFKVRSIKLLVTLNILLVSCLFGWAALNRREDITQPGGKESTIGYVEDGTSNEPQKSKIGPVEDGTSSEPKESKIGPVQDGTSSEPKESTIGPVEDGTSSEPKESKIDPLESAEHKLMEIETHEGSINRLHMDLVMETDPVMEVDGYKVFKGTRDNRHVAVKQIHLSDTMFEIAKNERKIHHACEDDSSNIMRLYGFDVADGFIYVCLQPWECSLGDLISFCSTGGSNKGSLYENQKGFLKKFNEENKLWKSTGPSSLLISLIKKVIASVADLHGYRIVHRNINPDTFFIISKGKEIIVKLGGLSMGKLHEDSKTLEEQIRYAPEQTQRKNKKEDLTNDVFFLGCVVGYSISRGQSIFKNDFGLAMSDPIASPRSNEDS